MTNHRVELDRDMLELIDQEDHPVADHLVKESTKTRLTKIPGRKGRSHLVQNRDKLVPDLR
jgi:hypothetical protein